MLNHDKHHVTLNNKYKKCADSRQYLFFSLALFFTKLALFTERGYSMEYTVDTSEFKQQVSATLVYVVSVIAAHYHYKRHQFMDVEFLIQYRRFWLFIALLPLVVVFTNYFLLSNFGDLDQYGFINGLNFLGFYESNDINYLDGNPFKIGFWHKTAMWMLFILTASLAPAIHQNRSNEEVGGLLLFIADGCALVYVLFYLTLPAVMPFSIFIGAYMFTITATIILVTSFPFTHVKQLARELLYELSFWLKFISLVLIFGVFKH